MLACLPMLLLFLQLMQAADSITASMSVDSDSTQQPGWQAQQQQGVAT
jgi:hypothetical protein